MICDYMYIHNIKLFVSFSDLGEPIYVWHEIISNIPETLLGNRKYWIITTIEPKLNVKTLLIVRETCSI